MEHTEDIIFDKLQAQQKQIDDIKNEAINCIEKSTKCVEQSRKYNHYLIVTLNSLITYTESVTDKPLPIEYDAYKNHIENDDGILWYAFDDRVIVNGNYNGVIFNDDVGTIIGFNQSIYLIKFDDRTDLNNGNDVENRWNIKHDDTVNKYFWLFPTQFNLEDDGS